METQNRAILKHLKKHRTITPMQALRLYGVFRLGARIYDLKDSGHKIITEIIEVTSSRGKKRVAEYRLLKLAKGAV